MAISVDELREWAKDLPDIEKLALVDALLTQLDRPDPEVDQIWLEEVLRRRQAYRDGLMEARAYTEIMKSFGRA
ncbi:MAG: addiction module protein [Candidatus Hydrogenedentes bacterium]|nr:addiction module protein [Candidatus Hydrogenedentota bacterium]MBI3119915.1 addiction module protein [Candidatus Hydrogenedentota bacterium]